MIKLPLLAATVRRCEAMLDRLNLTRMASMAAVTILAGCTGMQQASSPTTTTGLGLARHTPPPAFPTVDLVVPATDVWKQIRRGFAIPDLYSEDVDHWTRFYASRPQMVNTIMQRSAKYLYYVVQEINSRGLPTELALLPFVESAWNPTALSSAKASGLWQFIPSTGRHFNLRQDEWLDERRDPIASTEAALEYLEYLFNFQGDWHLALASYNWGEGAVRRARERNAGLGLNTDYLSLKMPDETRNYVPKLQAIKNIVANPQRYGIALPAVDNEPYFVAVPKSRDIDVTLAAQLANMPLDEFMALNPGFKRGIIPAREKRQILLPVGQVDTFLANLDAYQGPLVTTPIVAVAEAAPVRRATPTKAGASTRRASGKSTAGTRAYRVRSGDTLHAIAAKNRTTVKALLALNRLKHSRLTVGQTLKVPSSG